MLALPLHTTVSSCYACIYTSKRSPTKNWRNLVLHLNYKVTRFVAPIGCISWHLGGFLHCSNSCDYKLSVCLTILLFRMHVLQLPGRGCECCPLLYSSLLSALSRGECVCLSLLLSSLPCSILPGGSDVPQTAQFSPMPFGLSGCLLLKHARRKAELR